VYFYSLYLVCFFFFFFFLKKLKIGLRQGGFAGVRAVLLMLGYITLFCVDLKTPFSIFSFSFLFLLSYFPPSLLSYFLPFLLPCFLPSLAFFPKG